jgi:hypothetical protein
MKYKWLIVVILAVIATTACAIVTREFLRPSSPDRVKIDPETKQQLILKMDKFRTETGFKGSYNFVPDARVFDYLKGSFPLPEPTDTTIFMQNCQTIITKILGLYTLNGEPFTWEISKVQSSNDGQVYHSYEINLFQLYRGLAIAFPNKCMQFVKPTQDSLWQKNIPNRVWIPSDSISTSIEIVYHNDKKEYQITNGLFLQPLIFPVLNYPREKAIEVAKREFNGDVASIDCYLTAYPTNKAKTEFNYRIEWEIWIGRHGGATFQIDGTTGKVNYRGGWIE